ncbi:MAG: hypothetical protein SFZ03_12355 [Candidatus Melainabacteria bacterium]|nr:hypothetical protein [Candidatus Melainabacteria bacterium]
MVYGYPGPASVPPLSPAPTTAWPGVNAMSTVNAMPTAGFSVATPALPLPAMSPNASQPSVSGNRLPGQDMLVRQGRVVTRDQVFSAFLVSPALSGLITGGSGAVMGALAGVLAGAFGVGHDWFGKGRLWGMAAMGALCMGAVNFVWGYYDRKQSLKEVVSVLKSMSPQPMQRTE